MRNVQCRPDAALIPGHVLEIRNEQPLAPRLFGLEPDAVAADVLAADDLAVVGADVQLVLVDDLGIALLQRRLPVDVVDEAVGRVVGADQLLEDLGLGNVSSAGGALLERLTVMNLKLSSRLCAW